MTWARSSLRTGWWRSAPITFLLLMFALCGPAHAQSPRVTGDWEQFIRSGDTGEWRSLGVFRVEQTGNEYRMAPVTQVTKGAINSQGLSKVRFSGTQWTFNSDWGEYGVAEFRLQRMAPGVYYGWAYLKGKQRDENLWVLMK